MLTYEEIAENGVVEITLDGRIDRKGFDEAVEKMTALMEAHGEIGLLKHIVSIGPIAPAVLWDDLKFAFRHLRRIGPVAVVSDAQWIEVWTKLASPFWRAEVRFFEEDQLDEARSWLAERVREARRSAQASESAP